MRLSATGRGAGEREPGGRYLGGVPVGKPETGDSSHLGLMAVKPNLAWMCPLAQEAPELLIVGGTSGEGLLHNCAVSSSLSIHRWSL